MRVVHPDVSTGGAESTAMAARLNEALAILERATDGGRTTLAVPEAVAPVVAPLVLRAPSGDVFVRLLDAAYAIGDVTYIDPEAGLIQATIGDGARPSRLLIELDTAVAPPRAAFRLDSDDAETAPDLADVVRRFAAALEVA